MPITTIHHGKNDARVEIEHGATLLKAIHQSGLQVSIPCGGRGHCGKCVVLARGSLDEPRPNELKLLKGHPVGTRLACCAAVYGECEIWLPEASAAVIETAYSAWTGDLEPIYGAGYGAAFDIGTTTVAGQLFHHSSKKPVAALGEMNAQQSYGADVLTRLVYCNEHTVAPLQNLIRRQLTSMLERMCQEADVPYTDIHALVVAGNSIMQCIFCGIEPGPLGVAPFTMPTHFGAERDFTLEGFPNAPIYVSSSASAYIGGDITCSVLASHMWRMPGNLLLIDAGTNGEMVLSAGGRLFCCSTAAGPAFEGANIQCGSNASAGAVDGVWLADGQIRHTTVGQAAPANKICGSGLIDAIAVMLDCAVLNANGRIAKEYNKLFTLPETSIFITQDDIRQVQLAKAAVRAGIDTLLHECGIGCDELDAIILCGGFGTYLRPESAERIGLLPPGVARKTRAIGNAAGNGAGQILQSKARLQEAKAICGQMETKELATNPFFTNRFIASTLFP